MSKVRWLLLLLLVVAWSQMGDLCTRCTKGFALVKVARALPAAPGSAAAPLLSLEEAGAYAQHFRYLGAGGQCFAFLSADGHFVLKLLRDPWGGIPLLPRLLSARSQARRLARRERDFQSYELADKELREETGLLRVHLYASDRQLPRVAIVDPLGIRHSLDLNERAFLLQRRAELAYPYLEGCIARGEEVEVRRALDSLVELLAMPEHRGIVDEDVRIHRNIGFLGQRALLIDIGRLRRGSVPSPSRERSVGAFRLWLGERSPSLAAYLEQLLQERGDAA